MQILSAPVTPGMLQALINFIAMHERKSPSLFESVAETALLLGLVVVMFAVPLLLCDWLARLALPIPADASPESQAAVTAQRDALVKWLFGSVCLVFTVWAMWIH